MGVHSHVGERSQAHIHEHRTRQSLYLSSALSTRSRDSDAGCFSLPKISQCVKMSQLMWACDDSYPSLNGSDGALRWRGDGEEVKKHTHSIARSAI